MAAEVAKASGAAAADTTRQSSTACPRATRPVDPARRGSTAGVVPGRPSGASGRSERHGGPLESTAASRRRTCNRVQPTAPDRAHAGPTGRPRRTRGDHHAPFAEHADSGTLLCGRSPRRPRAADRPESAAPGPDPAVVVAARDPGAGRAPRRPPARRAQADGVAVHHRASAVHSPPAPGGHRLPLGALMGASARPARRHRSRALSTTEVRTSQVTGRSA